MDKTKIFPIILMILDIGAAVVYFAHGDVRRGVYWIAAAILSFCVVF